LRTGIITGRHYFTILIVKSLEGMFRVLVIT
jgi:hypothetical protein